jgi:hypothetical protein
MKQLFLLLIVFGCTAKEDPKVMTSGPDIFELTYDSGWAERLSFRIDSSGVFIASKRWDTIYYGQAPDSIILLIDSTLQNLPPDNSASFQQRNHDGSAVSIRAIYHNRQFTFKAANKIPALIIRLVSDLIKFRGLNHPSFNQFYIFGTDEDLIIKPPPIIE